MSKQSKSAKRRIRVRGHLFRWTSLFINHFAQIACGSGALLALFLSILRLCPPNLVKELFRDCVLSAWAGSLFAKGTGALRQKEQAEIAALIFRLLRR